MNTGAEWALRLAEVAGVPAWMTEECGPVCILCWRLAAAGNVPLGTQDVRKYGLGTRTRMQGLGAGTVQCWRAGGGVRGAQQASPGLVTKRTSSVERFDR